MKDKKKNLLTNAESCKRYRQSNRELLNRNRRERYRRLTEALALVQMDKERGHD